MGSRNNGSPKANKRGQPSITAGGTINYGTLTDADAQQIRDDVDAMYTPSVRDAIKQYIANDTKNTGKQYSKSQTLNHKLNNNLPLNANEQYMDKYLQKGMHDIGKNVTLIRGCHEDFLQSLGISDYASMTESQLKQKLVNMHYTTKSYSSFSYDISKNPFLGNGQYSGGREIIMKQYTKSTTKVVFGAKSQAEIITNKGTGSTIKNVYFDTQNEFGGTATPKGSYKSKPVLVVEVETD